MYINIYKGLSTNIKHLLKVYFVKIMIPNHSPSVASHREQL
jgi:hypothetical protein